MKQLKQLLTVICVLICTHQVHAGSVETFKSSHQCIAREDGGFFKSVHVGSPQKLYSFHKMESWFKRLVIGSLLKKLYIWIPTGPGTVLTVAESMFRASTAAAAVEKNDAINRNPTNGVSVHLPPLW